MTSVLKVMAMLFLTSLIAILACAAGFGMNYYLTTQNVATAASVPAKFPLMWESWRLIKDQFYGDLPQSPALVHGMIRGMLQSLNDSHTILVEPQPARLEQNNLQGNYGGIGAKVEAKNGAIVLLPFPGGPAARAGVLANDALLKIDDKDLALDATTEDVEILLRGDIGSTVKLTVHRVGESGPIELGIKREKIDIPTVQYRVLDNGIAYVQVTLESADTAKEFENALTDLGKKNPKGVILDLRNNPGGLFPDPVLEIAGEFLPSNSPVVLEHYRDGSEKTYPARGGHLAADLPLVVLVNGGTASDAEILAGALQDSGRAVLVGEKTFGKGSVQSLHELSDKSVLHITIATWFTPKHNQIDGTGLKPNVAVPLTADDTAKGVDPQLDRAVEYLKTGK